MKVTITIPPIAGPFLAIPAKPYLNSCCQSGIRSILFKYITTHLVSMERQLT